jgi:hypothetical protein
LREADRLKERRDWFGVEPIGARHVHEGRIEGADLRRIRSRGRLNAIHAAFKNVTDAGLGGNVQGGVHADRAAIARYASAVIPGTVAIAEKIVAGIRCKIGAGKVEAPARGRSRTRGPFGGTAGRRDQKRDGQYGNAAGEARHWFLPLDRSAH